MPLSSASGAGTGSAQAHHRPLGAWTLTTKLLKVPGDASSNRQRGAQANTGSRFLWGINDGQELCAKSQNCVNPPRAARQLPAAAVETHPRPTALACHASIDLSGMVVTSVQEASIVNNARSHSRCQRQRALASASQLEFMQLELSQQLLISAALVCLGSEPGMGPHHVEAHGTAGQSRRGAGT